MAQTCSAAEARVAMALLNWQSLVLLNSVQIKSRKYQTLSNASKARHDVAMPAICDMRAQANNN
jgi:hypothetical protein